MSIGDTLAAARLAAGLTIAQVSELTRIRQTIIRGIESGDFSACGADIYARGHIRSIARVVGTDAGPLITAYDAQHAAPQAAGAEAAFDPSRPIRLTPRRSLNWTAAMGLALALIVGFAVYHVGASPGTARTAAHAAGQARAGHQGHPAGTSRRSAAAPGAHRATVIRLAARDDCWVQLSTSRGRTIFSGIIPAGTGQRWTERWTVRLRLGNPGGVTLTVNGRRLDSGRLAGQTLMLRPGHRPVPRPAGAAG